MCVTVIPFCALSCAALHCCCPAGHHSGPDCGLPVGHHHPNSLRGAPGHVPRLTLSPGGQADGLAGRPAGIVAGNSFCRARHLVMCVQQAPAEPPTLHYSRYPLLPAPFHLLGVAMAATTASGELCKAAGSGGPGRGCRRRRCRAGCKQARRGARWGKAGCAAHPVDHEGEEGDLHRALGQLRQQVAQHVGGGRVEVVVALLVEDPLVGKHQADLQGCKQLKKKQCKCPIRQSSCVGRRRMRDRGHARTHACMHEQLHAALPVLSVSRHATACCPSPQTHLRHAHHCHALQQRQVEGGRKQGVS